MTGEESHARAACVVNCAEVWADRVNGQFGIESPYKHAFSKGVFAGIKKATGHEVPLIFELGELDTPTCVCLEACFIAWPDENGGGHTGEGFAPASEDVSICSTTRTDGCRRRLGFSDITMLHTGIRPLVVDRDYESNIRWTSPTAVSTRGG